ncbi:MAG: hypothetical protein AB8G86_23250 [Saprospiraceae bacterium]
MKKYLNIENIPKLEGNRTTKLGGLYNGKAFLKYVYQKKGVTKDKEWEYFSTLVQFEDGYTCWSLVKPHLLLNNLDSETKFCKMVVKPLDVNGYIKNVIDIIDIYEENKGIEFPDFFLIDPDLIDN